eukprot:2170824-Amphidinium_carterae.1
MAPHPAENTNFGQSNFADFFTNRDGCMVAWQLFTMQPVAWLQGCIKDLPGTMQPCNRQLAS